MFNLSKEQIIELVKVSAQEIIDMAEDLVGDYNMVTDFDICIHFPIPLDRIPTIEVTRKHEIKNSIPILSKF